MYRRLRSITAPVRPWGSRAVSLGPSLPAFSRAGPAAARVEPSGAVISFTRLRCHSHSSAASAATDSSSCARACPYEPREAESTAPTAEAGGSQRTTSAAGSSAASPPACPSRCAPKLTNWKPTAITSPLSTARSRPLREVSSRVLAVATARASATHSSSVSGAATTANTAPTAPLATAKADPAARQSVNSGPIPISEDASSAPISGRGRSGSITSRLGSSVSSPAAKKSGITAQPTATSAASSTTRVAAWE